VTTIAASNQGRVTLLGFEEGNADGSVHDNDLDDVLGDLGDSDEEGDEADIHHDGLLLRTVLEGSNQSIGDDADNIDMFAGEELQYGLQRRGSRSINGVPDGWHPWLVMSATCRRHGKMSPIFVPTGQIWRHVFLCVGTLLCRDFPTLTYHEQTIFG
jgi:hypothetical protein